MERRLKELRDEMELGQKQLAALEARAAELRNTLFRIGGAIHVLEDVLANAPAAAAGGDAPPGAERPAS
ncbi:hypothetical protein WME79_17165 [Sorangium sp. So ce726]|uniref:hypothetical protein n=1 Tax=Sorangium sp. So ce726 TaxID=3133319 RepID=UPI003F5E7785